MRPKFISARFCVTIIIWIILYDSMHAQPGAECSGTVQDELTFDRITKELVPNPVPIRLAIRNTGNVPLQNANGTIIYFNSDFDLVRPLLLTQQFLPSTILPGDSGVVQWELSAKKKRGKWDTVQVCIISSYDNHPTNTCCWKIIIPPTEPIIHCTKHIVPTISIDSTYDGYEPMPFTIISDYVNEGGCSSDSLFATLFLSPLLQLDSSENNQTIKALQPAMLKPGEHATLTWTLWHPIVLESNDYEYQVSWSVREKNYDSSTCMVLIIIPSLAKSLLDCAHEAPAELQRDTVNGVYTPNPFPVTIRIINNGELAADSVRATIILPPDIVMNPSSQESTRFFNPMKVFKWHDGMSPNEILWNLELTKIPKTRKCYTIQYRIDGVNTSGRVDPCIGSFDVCVSPMRPFLICNLEAPLSLSLDSARTRVIPNPFSIRYVLRNIGSAPIGIRQTKLFIDSTTGVMILPATPNPLTWNKNLRPADSIIAIWYCQVINSLQERIVPVEILSMDENGNPDECAYNLFIPAVDSLLDIRGETGTGLSFHLGQNYPNPFSALTIVDVQLPNEQQGRRSLKVYDLFGREVLDLSDRMIDKSTVSIEASRLPSRGIYFCRLSVGNQSQTRIMTFAK